MSRNFYYPYLGNKRTETKHFIERVTSFLDTHPEVKTIVEPFCGSCAFSFDIFQKYGDKYRYIMNDKDAKLIEFFTEIKKNTSKPFFDFVDQYWNKPILTQELYKELIAKKDEDIFHWFFWHRCYTMYKGRFYPECRNAQRSFTHEIYEDRDKFVACCEFSNKDYAKFLEPYLDSTDTLIFWDPPYFQSCNGYYYDCKEKVTEDGFMKDYTVIWIDILKALQSLTPSLLVSNYTSLLHHILKDFFTMKYGKCYSMNSGTIILKKNKTRRKTQHVVYDNLSDCPASQMSAITSRLSTAISSRLP